MITTNTVEGYFSILKCKLRHLSSLGPEVHRPVSPRSSTRYNVRKLNDDARRATVAVKKTRGQDKVDAETAKGKSVLPDT